MNKYERICKPYMHEITMYFSPYLSLLKILFIFFKCLKMNKIKTLNLVMFSKFRVCKIEKSQ